MNKTNVGKTTKIKDSDVKVSSACLAVFLQKDINKMLLLWQFHQIPSPITQPDPWGFKDAYLCIESSQKTWYCINLQWKIELSWV